MKSVRVFLLLLLLLIPVSISSAASHQAVLNWQNNSCNTSKPCSIQVYRATCTTSTSCPSYPSGFAVPPTATLAVTVNATATNTTWSVTDTDPALADATTYVYVATNTFTGSTTAGPPSGPWSGTTNPAASAPVAPVIGSGNSIQ